MSSLRSNISYLITELDIDKSVCEEINTNFSDYINDLKPQIDKLLCMNRCIKRNDFSILYEAQVKIEFNCKIKKSATSSFLINKKAS